MGAQEARPGLGRIRPRLFDAGPHRPDGGWGALAGQGIAYVPERAVRPLIGRGTLAIVLDDWCPWMPGLYLNYLGHKYVLPGLQAFIDLLVDAR